MRIDVQEAGVKPIDLDNYVGVLESSQVRVTLDLGSVLIHKVNHPDLGNVVLVHTPENDCALIAA